MAPIPKNRNIERPKTIEVGPSFVLNSFPIELTKAPKVYSTPKATPFAMDAPIATAHALGVSKWSVASVMFFDIVSQ